MRGAILPSRSREGDLVGDLCSTASSSEMLRRAVVLVFVLVASARCDFLSDFAFLNNPDPWGDWTQPGFSRRSASVDASELTPDGREREPLGPGYKDPTVSSSDQKPVLNPKPKPASPPSSPTTTTARPNIVPHGVIDVDANGVPKFLPGSPFGSDFDFPVFDIKPGSFGFGGIFNIEQDTKWWKGPNVCIDREESTDDDEDDEEKAVEGGKNETDNKAEEPNLFSTAIRLSNCFETANKYECITKINNHGVVKTFTVRYKCCYGYKRTDEGCTKQVELKPILDTLGDMKLDEFMELVKSSDLNTMISEGNYTIFAPSDDAINDYTEKMIEMNNVEPLRRRRRAIKNALPSKDLVLSHVVKGFVDLNDLSNEEIINSEDNNSTIRINIYPTHTYEKMLTANCARVKKGNVLAKNGIVHITDRVVVPATESIEDIIRTHPKLQNLRKVWGNIDITKNLKADGHYTLFAPTDQAFDKLDETQRKKILNGGGCASNILKHHVTAHTVCSSAIIGNATTHNIDGTVLNMERTLEDELIFENKAKIVEPDIIATNGVIHLIDELIIPESGQYIGNVMKASNLTKFQELVEKAELTEEINNLENATVFVPSDTAFEQPQVKKLLEDIGDDKTKLRDLVRYHTVQGEMESCHMNNNVKLKTRDDGKELRINLYSTLPLFTNVVNRATVNCARLIGFDEKACGSVVHEVSKVLIPPTKSIYDILNEDPKYSILRDIMRDTEVEKVLKESNRSITFLAPTDETFAALDESDRKMLLENKEKAEAILKNHILEEVLCCSGVGPHTWGFNSYVPTMGQSPVEINRTGSQVRVNRAVVTSCDNLATNGVVHTINKVLAPRKKPMATIGGGLFFFDF